MIVEMALQVLVHAHGTESTADLRVIPPNKLAHSSDRVLDFDDSVYAVKAIEFHAGHDVFAGTGLGRGSGDRRHRDHDRRGRSWRGRRSNGATSTRIMRGVRSMRRMG